MVYKCTQVELLDVERITCVRNHNQHAIFLHNAITIFIFIIHSKLVAKFACITAFTELELRNSVDDEGVVTVQEFLLC